jgi:hypothetical protein
MENAYGFLIVPLLWLAFQGWFFAYDKQIVNPARMGIPAPCNKKFRMGCHPNATRLSDVIVNLLALD